MRKRKINSVVKASISITSIQGDVGFNFLDLLLCASNHLLSLDDLSIVPEKK